MRACVMRYTYSRGGGGGEQNCCCIRERGLPRRRRVLLNPQCGAYMRQAVKAEGYEQGIDAQVRAELVQVLPLLNSFYLLPEFFYLLRKIKCCDIIRIHADTQKDILPGTRYIYVPYVKHNRYQVKTTF